MTAWFDRWRESSENPNVSITFKTVAAVGRELPGVELAPRYDGSRVLKAGGCFMAGPASHFSAEPGTLVVRIGLEERSWLLEDAPDTYYVTDYYEKYPVVLVRLSRIDRDALRDLLRSAWRETMAKTQRRSRAPRAKVNPARSGR